MKDEMIARMMEEMSIMKQEKERVVMQNQSTMMMMMQVEAEMAAQREADRRAEQAEQLRSTQANLKRSEEARGALKAEMEKLKELFDEREGEQEKSAQGSMKGVENLKKTREKITRETERIREKLVARKQSTASPSTGRTKSMSIMTMNITSEEEKNAQEERTEETRESIKREEEKEREEEREENEEENMNGQAKREDDVEVIDEARSKCNEEIGRKTVYEVKIGVKTNLGGMNGSNIGANEREIKRATEFRSGREQEAKTETLKLDINEWEAETVQAFKMVKRASSGHDLERQKRIGKPKVKIKDSSKRKVVDCCFAKIQHGQEQEGSMKIRKIEKNLLLCFWVRRYSSLCSKEKVCFS